MIGEEVRGGMDMDGWMITEDRAKGDGEMTVGGGVLIRVPGVVREMTDS
jgi:hypothetical protein